MSDAELSLALMGDLLLGGIFSQRAEELIRRLVPVVADSFLKTDIGFANLECPCSNRGEPIAGKNLHYCFPEALEALTRLRVNVVSLANNHILDYGMEAVEDTIVELDKLGVAYAGAGRNLEAAQQPAIVNTRSGIVAFLCFSWTHQWTDRAAPATQRAAGVNPWDVETAVRLVQSVRERLKPRLIVVSVHWGEGKSLHPRPDSVREARQVIAAGADLIVGHHTHCLQTAELYQGKPIFYSLGNCIVSPFSRGADRRMTYAPQGGNWVSMSVRERRTLLARVDYFSQGRIAFDLLPLVQGDKEPVLIEPDRQQRSAILRTWHTVGARVSRPGYATRYPIYRRWDEALRNLEELRERGLRDVTWRTPRNVLRKLVQGRNMS